MYGRRLLPWQCVIIAASAVFLISGCESEDTDYVEGGDPLPQSSSTNNDPQDTPLAGGEATAPPASGGEAPAPPASGGQPASAGNPDDGPQEGGSDEPDRDREPASAGEANIPDDGAEPTMSIVELAQGNADLSQLVEAVVASGLAADLGDNSKTFTVFAPTNAAFEALAAVPEGDALGVLLSAHIIKNSKIMAADITDGLEVGTLNGNARLNFAIVDGNVTVTLGDLTAKVLMADIEATNGVVHVIDAVLVP